MRLQVGSETQLQVFLNKCSSKITWSSEVPLNNIVLFPSSVLFKQLHNSVQIQVTQLLSISDKNGSNCDFIRSRNSYFLTEEFTDIPRQLLLLLLLPIVISNHMPCDGVSYTYKSLKSVTCIFLASSLGFTYYYLTIS